MANYRIKKPPFVKEQIGADGVTRFMLEVIPEDEHEPNVIATTLDVLEAFEAGYQDGHSECYDEAQHAADDE